MNDVAREVGILKGSLYHHFESKEDMLMRVFAQATEETAAILGAVEESEGAPLERIEAFVREWSLWYLANLEMVSVYLAEWKNLTPPRLRRALETRRKVFERVQLLVEAAIEAGEVPPAVESRYAAFYLLSVINGLPTWYRREGADEPEAIAEIYARAVGRMLRSADGSHGDFEALVAIEEGAEVEAEVAADDRTAELLGAAIAAFHEEGYARSSLQDIADRTSMFRGSLYHYMDSKEGLLAQIFVRATEESFSVLEAVEAAECPECTEVDRIFRFVGAWSLWYMQNLEVVSIYVDEWKHLSGPRLEQALATRRRVYEVVEGYVEAAWDGDCDQREARYVALLVLSSINGLTGWYRRGGSDDPHRIAAAYAELSTALVVGGLQRSGTV